MLLSSAKVIPFLGLLISTLLSLRFSIIRNQELILVVGGSFKLTLFDLEIFRRDNFDILIRNCVAEGLQLFRWAAIVFKHDKESLSAGNRSLALTAIRLALATIKHILFPSVVRFARKQAIVNLLH